MGSQFETSSYVKAIQREPVGNPIPSPPPRDCWKPSSLWQFWGDTLGKEQRAFGNEDSLSAAGLEQS